MRRRRPAGVCRWVAGWCPSPDVSPAVPGSRRRCRRRGRKIPLSMATMAMEFRAVDLSEDDGNARNWGGNRKKRGSQPKHGTTKLAKKGWQVSNLKSNFKQR